MAMDYLVKALTERHIDEAVEVHMRAFPDFFLSFLGPRFLREFYRSFTYDMTGIGYVAVDKNSGKVLGVVVGPFSPAGYFKRLLKRRWWAFCAASIIAIIKRPKVIKRLARAVFYKGETPAGSPRSLLSSIAVAPEVQGMGIGRSLVETWVSQVRKRGGHGCFLTTDAVDNDATARFYRKCGWTIESTYQTPEGRKMNRYVLDFQDGNQDQNS